MVSLLFESDAMHWQEAASPHSTNNCAALIPASYHWINNCAAVHTLPGKLYVHGSLNHPA
jgi:hypothetical protein